MIQKLGSFELEYTIKEEQLITINSLQNILILLYHFLEVLLLYWHLNKMIHHNLLVFLYFYTRISFCRRRQKTNLLTARSCFSTIQLWNHISTKIQSAWNSRKLSRGLLVVFIMVGLIYITLIPFNITSKPFHGEKFRSWRNEGKWDQ